MRWELHDTSTREIKDLCKVRKRKAHISQHSPEESLRQPFLSCARDISVCLALCALSWNNQRYLDKIRNKTLHWGAYRSHKSLSRPSKSYIIFTTLRTSDVGNTLPRINAESSDFWYNEYFKKACKLFRVSTVVSARQSSKTCLLFDVTMVHRYNLAHGIHTVTVPNYPAGYINVQGKGTVLN